MLIIDIILAMLAFDWSGCPGYCEVIFSAPFAIINEGIERQIPPTNKLTIAKIKASMAFVDGIPPMFCMPCTCIT